MTTFSNLVVQQIFTTPLAMLNLEGDPALTLESVKDFDWGAVDGVGKSPGNDFLGRYPVLREQVMEAFGVFKGEFLGLANTDFGVASSWMTYCEPGATGVSHRHYNSMFTGVYYPFPGDYSELEISRTGLEPTSFLLRRENENQFTASSLSVVPYQSLLVFFPSYIIHRITKNTSAETRYSVAFNFHPIGPLGNEDSSVHITGVKSVQL